MTENLKSLGIHDVAAYVCNVADEAEVRCAVTACLKTYGTISILVNSAGIYNQCSIKDMTLSRWQETLNVNLNSTFFFCRDVISTMMNNRYGKIINITSQAGVQGSASHAHYAASKAGIIGLSRSLAKEVAAYRINVNCIAPGIIKTPMTSHYTEAQKEHFLRQIPLQRFGEVDDVAKLVEFLASDGSDYVTGQVLNVTGGWLLLS